MISTHCQKAMDMRDIYLYELIDTVEFGEVIAKYDMDKLFPSKLMLKFVNDRPLHVVVAQNPFTLLCILITAYLPDTNKWHHDFKTRKIF
jgi:hypothetical protein